MGTDATSANGKIALVTGGSRGIGRAVALQLARDGNDVCFCYLKNGEAAEEVAAGIVAAGRRVYHAPCDVARHDSVCEFVAAAEREIGPVTSLVNNAGIVRDNPLVLMDPKDWSDVLDTNLTGTFNLCRQVAFAMLKRKHGVIVNLSSIAGVYGNATQTNYSASKAGIIGFSKSLAKEVGPYGVRVNVVAPGFIVSDMTAALDDKRREKARLSVPLRRLGEAEDVAEVVSFLVSDRARYITGQVVQVDGGMSL